MKNFHFSGVALVIVGVLFIGGCGAQVQQQSAMPNNNDQTTTVSQPVIPANTNVEPTPVEVKTPPATVTVTPPPVVTQPNKYILSEVAKHNNANDCWVVIDSKIYNLTTYIPQHPKGPEAVIRNCGKDGTSIFDLKHSPDKKQYLTPYFVTDLQK